MARGDQWGVAVTNANVTMALLRTEGPDQARRHLGEFAADAVSLGDQELSITIVELFACVLSELGAAAVVGRLMGAADAQRERLGMPRPSLDTVRLDESLPKAMELLPPGEWEGAYAAGQGLTVDEAVTEALGVYANSDLPTQGAHSGQERSPGTT